MTFLRPRHYGDSERNFRVFGATTAWGKAPEARIRLCIWAKSYNPGGGTFLVVVLIAEMEFRPTVCWPKRAHHGD